MPKYTYRETKLRGYSYQVCLAGETPEKVGRTIALIPASTKPMVALADANTITAALNAFVNESKGVLNG